MPAITPSARWRFYPLIAIVLALFVFFGFSRTYYLRFLSDRPPLRAVFQLHGVVLTAWVLLFVVQTQLVAARRADLHRRLGAGGAVLGLFVIVITVAAMLASAATPRTTQLGLTAPQASIVPLSSIVPFTVFVVAGLAWRHRATLHKRLMLLAMLTMLGPPSVRLIAWIGAQPYALPIQMSVYAAFVIACLVYDWRKYRTVHPVLAVGGIVLVLLLPLRLVIARSQIWQPVGERIAEMGRHLFY